MKKLIPYALLIASVTVLVTLAAQPVAGQGAAAGKLAIFADMALFSGPQQPRNCFTMNRYKVGENVGFRVSVIDGATGMPAQDAEVVSPQPEPPADVDCRVEALKVPRVMKRFNEDDLVMREFLRNTSRQLIRKGAYRAA